MIKINQFQELLEKLEIPVAYNDFRNLKAGQPFKPYMAWYTTKTEPVGADNKVVFETYPVILELYTENKDFNLELKLKKLLNEAGIFYKTSDSSLEEEHTHITYFMITLGG